MLTFCSSYVLWLLHCVQLRLVTITFTYPTRSGLVLCDLTDDERDPVEGAGPERHLRLQGEEGLQREGGVVQVREGGEGEASGRREDEVCRFGLEAGQDGDVIC